MGDGHAVIAGGLDCSLGGCCLNGFGLAAMTRILLHTALNDQYRHRCDATDDGGSHFVRETVNAYDL